MSLFDDTTTDADSVITEDSYKGDGYPRHLGRPSMISTRSYDSSTTTYDMLLARLDSKETLVVSVQPQKTPIEHHDTDWDFWSRVISDYPSFTKSSQKKSLLCLHVQEKGIPSSLRGTVWPLLTRSNTLVLDYASLLNQTSVYEKAIHRDICKPPLTDYKRKDVLFHVVKAYSIYDKHIGYHPGLLYMATPLLLHLPEEEAFSVLVQLLYKYNLRSHFFYPSAAVLDLRLYQFEGLVADHVPHVQRHLAAHGVRSAMYAHAWFLTLFSRFLHPVVCRIYDLLFLALDTGFEVLLFQLGLVLLERNDVVILGLVDHNELVQFLNDHHTLLLDKLDPEQWIRNALGIQISKKRMDRLAKDFKKRPDIKDRAATLKQENETLADTMLTIQKECEALTRQSTQMAHELATRKEEVVRVHGENKELRQHTAHLQTTLDSLPIQLEMRVQEEMQVLCAKNTALVDRNMALEEQLGEMERLLTDIKTKYAESEREKETLEKTWMDMKQLLTTMDK